MAELRDYQSEALGGLRLMVGSSGKRAPLLQMATGLGKTIVACKAIASAVKKGRSALVLVPRRQLVYQTSDKLTEMGVEHGVIMSGETPSLVPRVQIASVNTLYRRCFEDGEPVQSSFYGKGVPLPPADVVVIDEAHANFSRMAQSILAEYPDAVKIGMTATPCRADGRGLGEVYDAIVTGPSVRWAMDNGYLAELRYFGPSEWDLTGVKVQGGDYHQGQLSRAVNKTKLVGDVVKNWERIAGDKTTVVFAVDRKHARSLHEAFNGRGHCAEYIDGQTDNDSRHEIFRRLQSGESRVLCSVAVVDMGWDAPWAECAILARPTKSVARYLQAVGRILRPDDGKREAILIDHTGAVRELGFVDDDFEWSLEGVRKGEPKQSEGGVADATTITCPACKAVIRAQPKCPECGKELKSQAKRAIAAKEADLQEIRRREQSRAKREWTITEKARFYGELLGVAMQKRRKEGWAAHAYRERLGVWPNDRRIRDRGPYTPSAETLNWVRHLDIKRAKAKQKREAA